MNDLDKMRIDNMTSYVENYHSVVIKFRPKRKYFLKIGFMRQCSLHWHMTKTEKQKYAAIEEFRLFIKFKESLMKTLAKPLEADKPCPSIIKEDQQGLPSSTA
uniref:Uncharacterized protein n=1 Tax=Acrobeloides nanus TaxID=290746 RepID=A0A914C8Q8_9BILA